MSQTARSLARGRARRLQCLGVARAVETLVMAADEPAHGLGEAAELAEQPIAVLRMPRGRFELRLGQRAGLLQISSGIESFPMSWRRPPAARWRSRPGGRPSVPRPAPRAARRVACALGVFVLLGQANHERVHVRAEERLLRADELCGADVPDERARLGAAVEIPGDDAADRGDAEHLGVSEPPAELAEVERERRDERGGQPRDARRRRRGRRVGASAGGTAGPQDPSMP